MRSLSRNRRKIHYALCIGFASEGEFHETKPIYGAPVELEISVSDTTGSVYIDEYGKRVVGERKLVTARRDLPFDENTVFWIDTDDVTKPHDYVVSRPVSVGLNGATYYLRHVAVTRA